MKQNLLSILLSGFLLLLIPAMVFAQGTITGIVVDKDTRETVPGANVVIQGTSKGAMTDLSGSFRIKDVESGQRVVVISYVGYLPYEVPVEVRNGEISNLGRLAVESTSIGLREVQVHSDIAVERQTPIAVSTIRGEIIEQKGGNQEFPELLRTTPSVYATKQGGGFGDARINIRGFSQQNLAVMINGVPVNDMENGSVYWSNWAGLTDVASSLQVQRGLSASRLAISSVGGTINIITKVTEAEPGVEVKAGVGNDGYQKYGVEASTGLMDNGWAATVLATHTFGNGYIDGTEFKAYNYFAAVAKQLNENHLIQLTFLGAPQWHNQRNIGNFDRDLDGSYFTLNRLDSLGEKFNPQWGYYNGEEFTWRRNFYHKPIAFLNHYFTVNDKVEIGTTLYGSWGRGGGTGPLGNIDRRVYPTNDLVRDPETGLIDWNAIETWNSGGNVPRFGDNLEPVNGQHIVNSRNGLIRRASMNSHNWYGIISSVNAELNESLKLTLGLDLRTYKGLHYRRVTNLLGADAFLETNNVNMPNLLVTQEQEPKAIVSMEGDVPIVYNNDGLVRWAGLFGQLEYITEPFSAFIALAGSDQFYKRIDYFQYEIGKNESEWESSLGGSIKGGANYNFDEQHNVFVNAGYYSRQPNFDAVFLNNTNEVSSDYKNETVFGLEAGYGFTSRFVTANLNVYRTEWANRVFDREIGREETARFNNVAQVHTGIELEGLARITSRLTFNFMGSLGNWEYADNVSATKFNQERQKTGELQLFLDGVKVGDAAQTTASITGNYTFFDRLRFYLTYYYADDLYAEFNVATDKFFEEPGGQAVEVPSYSLVDTGLSFDFDVSGVDFNLTGNVNNLFDNKYIAELETNFQGEGVSLKDNIGFYGFGRTWNTTLRIKF